MPSQSVEAATRDEAIAAAREQFGPTARVVGVRRIRSGGMLGFFANERYIAEVEVTKDAPAPAAAEPGAKVPTSTPVQRPVPSLDDRMQELAELLGGAAQESPAVGLYGRTGAAAESAAPASPSLASLVASRSARDAGGATPRPAGGATPRGSAGSTARAAGPSSSRATAAAAAPARSGGAGVTPKRSTAKPFTPARQTLMLSPDDLVAERPEPAEPAAAKAAGPSPFAAALTRMVASNPVQAAAEAAADAAEVEAAAAEAAAAAQAAAVETAAAEAARQAAARIDAAAATAARSRAEAVAAEAARLKAQAAAAEAARLQAAAATAEAARLEAEAVAAEAARAEAERQAAERIEAERIEAERIEAARVEAARIEAARIEAARIEAARIEAARIEAARIEAARVEAARIEAERVEAARAEAARIERERIEAERLQAQAAAEAAEAARLEAERIEAERIEAERIEAARVEAERLEAARIEAERLEAARVEAARIEAERLEAARVAAETAAEAARLQSEAPEAPLSMVESVRSADEELAALLEEVLAANGSGRGRHRLPESAVEVPGSAAAAAVAAATAIVENAAQSAVPAAAVAEERVLDVPRPWAYESTAAEANAYDTGSHRTDAYSGGWPSDARVAQRAAQVAAAQNLVVDAVVVAETPAEEIRYVEPRPVEVPVPLARTASDPAPLPMDATMILPPLSLMPPQRFGSTGGQPLHSSRPSVPPARRGRPPVPASRSSVSGLPQLPTRPVPVPVPIGSRSPAAALPAAEESGTRLATVTRLVPAVTSTATALTPFGTACSDELVLQLLTLGVPDFLLGPDFVDDAAVRGVYAALTRTLSERLPAPPRVPAGDGEVLMVVGPGAETFAAARSLALSLRLEPGDVQWAASGALAGLAPEACRITSLDTAIERQRTSTTTGSVTIIAVDAPLRTSGGPWLEHMLSVWSPSAVWAVLDSTRKPEDLVPWLDGLPQLDAVVVQDTDSTADPAAVLDHVSVPVALVDGARATAHRWASLLCERLEELDR